MKLSKIPEILETCLSLKLPVLLVGSPGIGKSDIIAEFAKKNNYDFIIDHPSVADPVDVKGVPIAMGDIAKWIPLGNLAQLITTKTPTICLLDDLGQANPSIQAAYMQLLLARRLGDHKISDTVNFIAATNKVTDKSGAYSILEAVKSRFGTILEVTPDIEDWCAWALSEKLPHEFMSFVRFRPNLFNNWEPGKGMENTCTPRTFTNAARLWKKGCREKEVINGAIGEKSAIELLAYLQIVSSLPSAETILNNAKKASISKEPSILYATCGMLATYADRQWTDIVTYANRLPIEYALILMGDCIARWEGLKYSPEFRAWSQKHKEILL